MAHAYYWGMIIIDSFYDQPTGSYTHLITDPVSSQCAVIDPVLGFDLATSRMSDAGIKHVIHHIESNHLQLIWILETHAHADHLTAAQQLKRRCGGKVAVSRGITIIQKRFKDKFGFGADFSTEGEQFDRLLGEYEKLPLGDNFIEVIPTPGHTEDSISFSIDDNLFIGDTLFHPGTGTARCDFPGGNAAQLFDSIQKLLSFDDSVKLHLCHDYPAEDRAPVAWVTVADMKANAHLKASDNSSEKFVVFRTNRDKTLAPPKLIIPSIQVNIRAGVDMDPVDNMVLELVWPETIA